MPGLGPRERLAARGRSNNEAQAGQQIGDCRAAGAGLVALALSQRLHHLVDDDRGNQVAAGVPAHDAAAAIRHEERAVQQAEPLLFVWWGDKNWVCGGDLISFDVGWDGKRMASFDQDDEGSSAHTGCA